MKRKEEQVLIQNMLRNELRAGRISRRQFLHNMMVVGLGLGGVSVLAGCGAAPVAAPTAAAEGAAAPASTSSRILTPSFYQWIVDLHPGLDAVNSAFGEVDAQIAPVAGFDVARFVAEGKNQNSTWDVYVGQTPFVEMASLIEADVIEPWDNYIPKAILDDMIPSIREECSINGKLYSWPFLLDIIIQSHNANLVKAAGLPDQSPANWDEFIASSNAVVESGAALYGGTFDANGWRSLGPIAHSISTDTYYKLEGDKSSEMLFDFTSDSSVEALEIMNEILKTSAANALQPGASDGGVNQTPDEVSFTAQEVAYYVKYQNAPLRMGALWPDPSALRIGALPTGGEGSTMFWTTGAALFKWGQNKEKAAEYMAALTYDQQIWKDSISGSASGQPGQLPPYKSIYAAWEKEKPDWLAEQAWVPVVAGALDVAKAIPNHAFGLQQFVIGQPFWQKYFLGEVSDPKAALQEAKDAVVAEIKKTS